MGRPEIGIGLWEVLLDQENTQLQAKSVLTVQCPCGKVGVMAPSLYTVPTLAVPTQPSSSPLAFSWSPVALNAKGVCRFSFFLFFRYAYQIYISFLNFTLLLFYNIIYLR